MFDRLFTRKTAPYVFVAPFLLMFVVFWLWPIVQSVIWSTFEWGGISKGRFVLLDNYTALFSDYTFVKSLKNTIAAAVVYIVFLVTLAIILGFALNSPNLVGRTFFRTAFFLPVTVSLSVIALIFWIIYSPNNGILNKVLMFLGVLREPVHWLAEKRTALWSIVALRVWRATGYYTIFILAGLQAIPEETIEAGNIDGAGYLQVVRHIVLPQLKPVIVYIIIVSSIWAFQLFAEPWIMTKGAPNNETSTIVMFIYQNAFQFFKMGYASAAAYVLTIIIIAFAVINLRIGRES